MSEWSTESRSGAATDVFDAADGIGEMGALLHAVDWGAVPTGPADGWPQCPRPALSICLSARFPMLVLSGSKLVLLYNDAYRTMLGLTNHPQAMGQRCRDCWPELWNEIGPLLARDGETIWAEDARRLLDRNGSLEETCFTFSCSPVYDQSSAVGGILTAGMETTERVLASHPRSVRCARRPRRHGPPRARVAAAARRVHARARHRQHHGTTRAHPHVRQPAPTPAYRGLRESRPARPLPGARRGRDGFHKLPCRVYTTGEPLSGRDMQAILPDAGGPAHEFVFNYLYQPLRGPGQ